MWDSDPEPLARVRAAEFLALTSLGGPRPAMTKALAASESPVEADLILNTIVLAWRLRPAAPSDFQGV